MYSIGLDWIRLLDCILLSRSAAYIGVWCCIALYLIVLCCVVLCCVVFCCCVPCGIVVVGVVVGGVVVVLW